MQGPAYLAAHHLGGYQFYWTDDPHKAIRFFLEDQANTVMMAVRQLRGDLFPACLIVAPRAVEHVWVPGEGVKREGVGPVIERR